jgi:hypothetical protein
VSWENMQLVKVPMEGILVTLGVAELFLENSV